MNKKNENLKELLAEIEKRDGLLMPSAVVAEATPIDSPLHKYFEWSDGKAAHEYRLWQARHLIVSVKVEFTSEGEEDVELYHNARITIEDVPVRGYVNLGRVLSDKKIYKDVLLSFVKEIEALTRKYTTLKEINEIVDKNKLKKLKQTLINAH